MRQVKIDGVEYEWDTLSNETKDTLISLDVVENKLSYLRSETAIALTAKNAYLNALKEQVSKK